MTAKTSYREFLQQELGSLIDTLDLSDLQKRFLRSRWLDQVLWMEGRADETRIWYYRLRLATIIGGVLIPVFVSLDMSFLRYVSIILGIVVAISAAVEEFFHYGERWRHYRRTVELLKIEGWKFFQLSGSYSRYENHREAYPVFAARVEEIIQSDVDVYITEVVKERKEEREEKENDENERNIE
jgi:hypothetical protein